MLQLCFLFNGGGGFFVYDGGWVFRLMVVVGYFVHCVDGWFLCL